VYLMKVANPIYDVVFKYLLNDQRVAKLLISRIIDEEIISLDLRPTEFNKKLSPDNFTVFRIDFAATIKKPDGSEKLVLIEIQKAKYPTDIMRFRKYLGQHYQDKKNVYQDKVTGRNKALPIISLYFLGHKLKHTDAPVIKVRRQYIDLAEEKELPQKEEFIESLTHDSFIIQIPHLKERRRNNLEILLSIFDQSLKLSTNDHFLNLDETDYPDEFEIVIRQLLKAAAEEDVCEIMEMEDEILDKLENLEREILDKDKALEDKDKALEDKDRALEDKKKALDNAIKALVSTGMSIEDAKKIINA